MSSTHLQDKVMELTLLANKQTEEFAQLGYTATNVNSGVLHEAGEGDLT